MTTHLLNLAILEMLMMQDITWMVRILMEAVSLWNLQKGYHVVLENIWAEVLPLVLDVALIVA